MGFENGVKKADIIRSEAKKSLTPGGIFILGQEQDRLEGGFVKQQRFIGEVCNFQMWDSVVDTAKLYAEKLKPGNVFDSPITYRYELKNGAGEAPDCWWKCNKKGGPCEYCGLGKACCRIGWDDAGCHSKGCNGYHCCATVPAREARPASGSGLEIVFSNIMIQKRPGLRLCQSVCSKKDHWSSM